MAAGDISVVSEAAGVRQYEVASGATAINPGEPVMRTPTYSTGATDANTVVVLTDGKPTIGTDNFIGIAANAGTHTASAAGVVNVIVPIPHKTLIRGDAATGTNIDTASELTNILGDLITFDLSSSTYTLDEDDTANASGLEIVTGDTTKLTLDVVVDARAMRTTVS